MSTTIPNFFADRAVFLTGATGFCGKVILETLLRGCPEITKVYVLVRSKKDKSGDERMREILQTPLFDKVRGMNVKLLEKVIPINGDVVYDELGLSPEDTSTLREEVSVVIHSAALVHFGAPLQSVMKANVQGTKNMLGWAKELKSLKAFVYISTAFSNSGRLKIDEVVYPNHISPHTALMLCSEMPTDLLNSIVPQLLADNKIPYTFSKHLAEILVEESSGDIPVCIVRPSIVTAANKEPIPGWIDNLTGFNGVMAALVRGLFHTVRLNTRGTIDLIPVDHVSNLTLAAAMSTGLGLNKSEKIMVYNCSSWWNPFDMRKLVASMKIAASLTPMNEIYWYPFIFFTTSPRTYKVLDFLLHYLPCVLLDGALKLVGSKRKFGMVETYKRLKKLFFAIEDLLATDYEHSTRNTQMLFKQLSPEDQETFDFDIFAVDHVKFTIVGFHGLKKYAALEDDRDLPKARKNFKRLQTYHHMTLMFPIVLLAIFLVLYFA